MFESSRRWVREPVRSVFATALVLATSIPTYNLLCPPPMRERDDKDRETETTTCLCFLSAGINDIHHYTLPNSLFFYVPSHPKKPRNHVVLAIQSDPWKPESLPLLRTLSRLPSLVPPHRHTLNQGRTQNIDAQACPCPLVCLSRVGMASSLQQREYQNPSTPSPGQAHRCAKTRLSLTVCMYV